ncbi:TlpA family protein disulfide reductase [Acidipila rosea]|uniref:Thiol-disulfide isomerase/thioredoxin n=1 Tax=Acidipila rosea TaxID=768535 RepID=A0A4R1L1Z9_9BACT|nr:TlpA disulfide reductase family protein [Acidipila rosea]TCK72006.1 thiol-disulfide isomerase/thioredoxin [Acidipila rosea]
MKFAVYLSVLIVILFPAQLHAGKRSRPVNLSLKKIDGSGLSLRSLRGHFVVLNFWATWCGPCKQEMPLLVEAGNAFRPLGVEFVGASVDEPKTQPEIPAFLRQYRADYMIAIGATADDLARLKMGEAVPATAILNPDGTIAVRILGQLRSHELDTMLTDLLKDPAADRPAVTINHLQTPES